MYYKAFIFCNCAGLTKIILFRSEHCLSLSLHFCFSSCPSRNIHFSGSQTWSDCGRKGSLGSRGVIYHSQYFLTSPKFYAVSLRHHLCLGWLCFSALVENQAGAAALCCQPLLRMGRVSWVWGWFFRQIKPNMQRTAMENTSYHAIGYQPAFNSYS